MVYATFGSHRRNSKTEAFLSRIEKRATQHLSRRCAPQSIAPTQGRCAGGDRASGPYPGGGTRHIPSGEHPRHGGLRHQRHHRPDGLGHWSQGRWSGFGRYGVGASAGGKDSHWKLRCLCPVVPRGGEGVWSMTWRRRKRTRRRVRVIQRLAEREDPCKGMCPARDPVARLQSSLVLGCSRPGGGQKGL